MSGKIKYREFHLRKYLFDQNIAFIFHLKFENTETTIS